MKINYDACVRAIFSFRILGTVCNSVYQNVYTNLPTYLSRGAARQRSDFEATVMLSRLVLVATYLCKAHRCTRKWSVQCHSSNIPNGPRGPGGSWFSGALPCGSGGQLERQAHVSLKFLITQ